MKIYTLKTILKSSLYDPHSAYFKHAQVVLAVTTLISLGAFIYKASVAVGQYGSTLFIIEWGAVGIFTLEYLLRVWCAEPKRAYTMSPMGLIDLASILPTYLGLGDFTFLKAARFIRTMRIFRMLGLYNLSRFLPKKKKDIEKGK